MSLTIAAVSIDAVDLQVVARFWAGVLDWDIVEHVSDDEIRVVPPDDGFAMAVRRTTLPKVGPNRIHFDLTTTSQGHMDATVARSLELGGRHTDIGQGVDDEHVVLADPEGNELCVIEPGSSFLADTARIGGVNCDGTRALGQFWSQALDWPLVWDQDEETAIQSPAGGSKVTWSGPPLTPRNGRDRVRLQVASTDSADLDMEVERLVALGSQRLDGPGSAAHDDVAMTDPDGNEFRLLGRT